MDYFRLYKALEDLNLEIFTLNDVVKITHQNKTVVKSTLSRWVNQGKIFRLRNQYYSLRKIENKFLYQTLFQNTYIGLYAALEYYGSTTQRFTNLDLITKNMFKDQKVESVNINFHKVKNNLFFGFKKTEINNTDIFVSNIEKTIIDCVYFSSKVYISEAQDFIQTFREKTDTELLTTYLNRINSPVLNKRVGFLLEKNGLEIDNLTINNKYDRLNKNLHKEGRKDRRWKLFINEEL